MFNMDPTTTLISFMLSTPAPTKTVELIGSWDNFTRHYPMERDSRRGAGEWRGIHSFKDITLDGDDASTPKRSGGLKMGQEYWYYYELSDGTEIHNTNLPSTTSCPFLPGQPVNVLNVPTQVNPLRERSASEGATPPEIQTMNPADKFLAPRAAPTAPRPKLPRLNTAPSMLATSMKSATENGSRSPWSAKSLFGLKAAFSALPGNLDRGRLASPVARDSKEASFLRKDFVQTAPEIAAPGPIDGRSFKPLLGAIPRTMSSQEASSRKRDATPLRQTTILEESPNTKPLTIPDDILEDEFEDDDANFATAVEIERVVATRLSPPPTHQLHRIRTASPDIKPLPKLPTDMSPIPVAESPSMVPAPLNVRPHFNNVPRSHFSIDTISTELVSPTESQFSPTSSIYDSNDDEDGDGIPDESFTFVSPSTDTSPPNGLANSFQYSLPVDDHGSEATLKKSDVAASGFGSRVAVRETFGPQSFDQPEKTDDATNALDQLMAEMGFLSNVIVGKEI